MVKVGTGDPTNWPATTGIFPKFMNINCGSASAAYPIAGLPIKQGINHKNSPRLALFVPAIGKDGLTF